MASSLLRRRRPIILLTSSLASKFLSTRLLLLRLLSSKASASTAESSSPSSSSSSLLSSGDKRPNPSSGNYSSKIHLSPLLFSYDSPNPNAYHIELVDNDTWQVSSGLARAWQGLDAQMEAKPCSEAIGERGDGIAASSHDVDPDFDEIDNMRIRGNLFYKLDRDSKEFKEYSFDFHRRKSSSKGKEKNQLLNKDDDNSCRESKKKDTPSRNLKASEVERLPQIAKNEKVYALFDRKGSFCEKKKARTPTFNQLTGPYHEPFCLDIYISKASIRACVVHRVTSKVVAVAHSISKDMKFDLASTKNAAACAAVGRILADRALGDDIHDVVYTPRKGEKLEGKLQIALQSIIDSGVNVKVKLKQRNPKKADLSSVHQKH